MEEASQAHGENTERAAGSVSWEWGVGDKAGVNDGGDAKAERGPETMQRD